MGNEDKRESRSITGKMILSCSVAHTKYSLIKALLKVVFLSVCWHWQYYLVGRCPLSSYREHLCMCDDGNSNKDKLHFFSLKFWALTFILIFFSSEI